MRGAYQPIQDYTAHPAMRRAGLGLADLPRIGPMMAMLGPLEYQWLYRPGQGVQGKGGGGDPWGPPGGNRIPPGGGQPPGYKPPQRPPDEPPPYQPPPWFEPPPGYQKPKHPGPGLPPKVPPPGKRPGQPPKGGRLSGQIPPEHWQNWAAGGGFGPMLGRTDMGQVWNNPVFFYLMMNALRAGMGGGARMAGAVGTGSPGVVT